MKEQPPLVSVIIATRGRPKLLRRAIESVAEQSYPSLEVVVVDENDPGSGPAGETARVVEELMRSVAISYLRDRTPTWVCTARNEGAAAARGDYFAFLDDDDWWKREKIERQMDLFARRPELGLTYTGLTVVVGEGRVIKERYAPSGEDIFDKLLKENVIGTPSSAIVPARLFRELGGFDPLLPTRHDLDLYIRIAHQHPVAGVEEPLTYYLNYNPASMSKNFKNKMEGRRLIYEKHAEHYYGRPDLQAAYHYGTARLCLEHRRPNLARGYLRRSLALRFTGRAAVRWLGTFLLRG